MLVLVGADGTDGEVVHAGQEGRRVQAVRRPVLKSKFEDFHSETTLKLNREIN